MISHCSESLLESSPSPLESDYSALYKGPHSSEVLCLPCSQSLMTKRSRSPSQTGTQSKKLKVVPTRPVMNTGSSNANGSSKSQSTTSSGAGKGKTKGTTLAPLYVSLMLIARSSQRMYNPAQVMVRRSFHSRLKLIRSASRRREHSPNLEEPIRPSGFQPK